MKNIGWKLLALVLLLILIGVFFFQNTGTTSEIYLWVTKVQIKTWQLILIMFFLGGLTFCLIPITSKFKNKSKNSVFENEKQSVVTKEQDDDKTKDSLEKDNNGNKSDNKSDN